MRLPTLAEILALYKARNWHVDPDRPNILVIRKMPGECDKFDDMLVAWIPTAILLACRCTADAGRPSRENPRRRDGTAVWAAGQVVNGLGVGLHKGAHSCLVPRKPIPVLRYTSLTDTTGEPSTSWTTQIHRASATRESSIVGAYSEGCIVVANPNDFAELMTLVGAAVSRGLSTFSVALTEWTGRGDLHAPTP